MNRRTKSSSAAATSERSAGGFTLAEMLVVIVIVGLIASIAVPMLSRTGDLDTSAAARKLTSDLDYAQNYAITHQTEVRVMFDTNNNTYSLLQVNDDNTTAILTHPVTKKPYVVTYAASNGLESVGVSTADFSGNASVTFDAMGAPDNGGDVNLTAGGVTRQVTVAPVTGKVSVN